MKMFLRLFLVCLAFLAGGARAQTAPNTLVDLARPPLHKFFNDLKATVEQWTANATFLQVIDINHTLNRLFSLGEEEATNLIFNNLIPTLMSVLQGPAADLRGLLVTVRTFLQTQDTRSLANLLATAKSYVDLAIRSIDQLQAAQGPGDAKSVDPTPAQHAVPTSTPKPGTEAPTPTRKTGGGNSWWPFK